MSFLAGDKLLGKGKKEESRDAVLSRVKAERAARAKSRASAHAALTIQRHWRGSTARSLVAAEAAEQVLARFGPAAADANALLGTEEACALAGLLLRLLPPVQPPAEATARARHASALRAGIGLLLRAATATDAGHALQAAAVTLPVWPARTAKLLRGCAAFATDFCHASVAAENDSSSGPGGASLTAAASARLCAVLLGAPENWRCHAALDPGIARATSAALRTASAASPQLPAALAAACGAPRSGPAASVAASLAHACADTLSEDAEACTPSAWAAVGLREPDARNRFPPPAATALTSPAAVRGWLRSAEALLKQGSLSSGAARTLLANLSDIACGPRGGGLHAAAVLAAEGDAAAPLLFLRVTRAAVASVAGGRPRGDALEGALDALWPLAEQVHVAQLQSAAAEDKAVRSELVELLHDVFSLPGEGGGTEITTASSPALRHALNAWAFAPGWLAALWGWCSESMGLPKEAPAAATQAQEPASLKAGWHGMPSLPAHTFGVFVRLFAHASLAVDDAEMHAGAPLPLAGLRGLASSLVALVVRSHTDRSGRPPAPAKSSKQAAASALLARWAPQALRALYDLDGRRAFVTPQMWLAPYNATAWGPSGPPGPTAIARALLARKAGTGAFEADEDSGLDPAAASASVALAGLLSAAPQCVPYNMRVELFRALIDGDRAHGGWNRGQREGGPPPLRITVRRDTLLEDGISALMRNAHLVKGRLKVSFVNEAGLDEAGLDYGGLVKEFLSSTVEAGFDADRGLMTTTEQGGLAYPRPGSRGMEHGLQLLNYLGMIVGKAMYEKILIDVPLAPFFVTRLQGRLPMFDDLAHLDPELHKQLSMIKHYEGDVEDLCLEFTITEDNFGQSVVHELVRGGSGRTVTNRTKLAYVNLVADFHLNRALGAPAAAFAEGLSTCIPLAWLRLFSPREVNEMLAGGEDEGIDLEDMRAHATYGGGYTAGSSAVKLFWQTLQGFTPEERKALLRFVTSCKRPPLGGFKHLEPKLVIAKVDCKASMFAAVGGKDVDRLPSASTCFNMLKLPNYRRGSTMRKKLLYVISSGAGFELS